MAQAAGDWGLSVERFSGLGPPRLASFVLFWRAGASVELSDGTSHGDCCFSPQLWWLAFSAGSFADCLLGAFFVIHFHSGGTLENLLSAFVLLAGGALPDTHADVCQQDASRSATKSGGLSGCLAAGHQSRRARGKR